MNGVSVVTMMIFVRQKSFSIFFSTCLFLWSSSCRGTVARCRHFGDTSHKLKRFLLIIQTIQFILICSLHPIHSNLFFEKTNTNFYILRSRSKHIQTKDHSHILE